MNQVWWRTHLRRLPDLALLEQLGGFEEVDDLMPFLTEALDVATGDRVLDLGCGRGSFSVRMAQWGYAVTGVEESDALLAAAREAAHQRGVEVEFRQGDLLSLPERGVYDAALLLDFGTFADADNAQMLRTVAAALKPGGRAVFGTCNPYFWAGEPRTEYRLMEGIDVISRYQFDFAAGAVVSRVRCILPGGDRRDLPQARLRAYTLPELRGVTAATGLADLRVHGQDGAGRPSSERTLDSLRTPYFYCVALRPVQGESGEGI